jgi:hypothetical protein
MLEKESPKPPPDNVQPDKEARQIEDDQDRHPRAYYLRGSALSVRATVEFAVDHAITQLLRSWWKHLDNERSREHNITGPLHLVSLGRPIHLLARRAIAINDRVPIDESELSARSMIFQYHRAVDLL